MQLMFGKLTAFRVSSRCKISHISQRKVFLQSVASTKPLAFQQLTSRSSTESQFLFVGGKGGVGKTSSSSAIALSLSDQGFRTLIVSTDPAHSLGDALDINLNSGQVVPVVTESNLWALEIDVDNALQEFKEAASGLDVVQLSASLGVPKEIIESLALDDLASIFTNPPPGIDEIIALTKIFQYGDEKDSNGRPRFDRIIIDTAPTGLSIIFSRICSNLLLVEMQLK